MATWTVRQSGGDYATLALALSNASTVANDTISIEGTWTVADTSAATVADDNITITADSSSRHAGVIQASPSYYRLEVSGNHCITINNTGCVIEGIVIHQDGTGASDEGIRLGASGSTTTLRKCYIYANSAKISDQDGIHATNGLGTITVNLEQCVIHDFGRDGIGSYSQSSGDNYTWNLNSCTVFRNGRTGEVHDGNIVSQATNTGAARDFTFNIHNTMALDAFTAGTDYDEAAQNGTWNISYSIDSDNSISTEINTGTGNLASRVETDNTNPGVGDFVIFRDVTTYPYDLRLAASGTADNDAYEMHSTASAHGMTIPATDIAGNSRGAAYDCGAWEQSVAAAAGGGRPPKSRARYFANLLNH